MALALPDNGEVNNREADRQRRLTSDSGGHNPELDINEEEDDEFNGELQNGEFDDEEPGMLAHSLDSRHSSFCCFPVMTMP